MARIRLTATLLLLGATTSGCLGSWKGVDHTASASNLSLYSENQPVVHRTDYAFDVEATGDGLPSSEVARLADWFDSIQLRYGDRVSIDDGYAADGARRDVARLLAEYGLFLSDGAPVTAGNVGAGSVRVIVSRATASVPGCPNWRKAKLGGEPISTDSNFGCSINSNLAAMIADPNDLVLGQEGAAGSDPSTAEKAVKTYREARPTGAGGLSGVSTTGGN
jgi:pilus assembly protein CpaD